MKSIWRYLLGTVELCLLGFLIVGCGELETKPTPEYPKSLVIIVRLINSSDQETHMWVGSESISPGNKLQPGASRDFNEIGFTFLTPEEQYILVVDAGRNGAVIATKTLSVSSVGVAHNVEITIKAEYFTNNSLVFTNMTGKSWDGT